MKNKNLFIGLIFLSLTLPACDLFDKSSTRETILDKIVNIPKKLVLDIPQLPPLCDEISDLKKGFADILDGKLYYEEEGQGIPLVLISGGPGCTHHNFHPYFSQLKDIAKVIYYDQRGIGKSSSDDTGKTYTVKQAVEDLESLRQALKIDKWAVLGWSYGGLLAQCYALTYPQHCIGMILGASTTGVSDNVMQPIREKMFLSQTEIDAIENIRKMAREGKITSVQSSYNAALAGNWKRSYYHKPANDAMIRSALYVWNPAPGFEELMRPESNNLNAISFLKNKFDDFEIPTLIAEAKWELLWWNPDRIEDMRKNHPHAQLEIFEKSGHMIFVDEPERFFPMLRDFLKKSSETKIAYRPGKRLSWTQPNAVVQKDASLLIIDFDSGKTIKSIGDCQSQESPCSTFKIALSLMGFDSGILKDDNSPEWPYKDEYNASLDFWRQPHTPKMWMKNSCVWYSQVLTSILGMDKFQSYVKNFEYGNQNISGNPGKDDGLSKSWLCSSLKISPKQQVEFIKKLLTNSLPISKMAHEQTKKILLNSDLGDGWKLYAKTGGGILENTSRAWLVGWATNEIQNKTYIFASLVQSNDNDLPTDLAMAKQNVLDELSKLRGTNDK